MGNEGAVWTIIKDILDTPGIIYLLPLIPVVLFVLIHVLVMRGYVRDFIEWENKLIVAAAESGLNYSGFSRLNAPYASERVKLKAYFWKAVRMDLRLKFISISGTRDGMPVRLYFTRRSQRSDDHMIIEAEFPSPLPIDIYIRHRNSISGLLSDRKSVLSADKDIFDIVEVDSPDMEAAERLLLKPGMSAVLKKLYYHFPKATVSEKGLRFERAVNINIHKTPDFRKIIHTFSGIAAEISRTG